jgi:hypothetical protein
VAEIRRILEFLSRPESLCFPGNREAADRLRHRLADGASQPQTAPDGTRLWQNPDPPARTAVKQYPSGHVAFFDDASHRRFLFTDPGGTPLHECEWESPTKTGNCRLVRARMQLDCRQWIGLKPQAKTFTGAMDITHRPDWRTLTLNDLRRQAAEAWQAPLSEVEYFYKDSCFTSQGDGQYRIQINKDVLYALPNATFDNTVFISCLFAVNWARLDIIPVVELFQSTLPGSGAAAFELLWGLYDDQTRDAPLAPLRYRGLPTYPSKEAFNIFSAFFTPAGPPGEKNLFTVFMDTQRSNEITWTPRQDPPWRYFLADHQATLAAQAHYLYKATLWDDPVAVPFVNRARSGGGNCQRQLHVADAQVRLLDGAETVREIPLNPDWDIRPTPGALPAPIREPFGWRRFFDGQPPTVDPVKALYTVPLYPEGLEEIAEASLQPMVLDQIFYYMELSPALPEKLDRIRRVLIHTFDSVISGCIDCTHEREYNVLYGDAEFAQKNAQLLWNYAAVRDQLQNLGKVRFFSEKDHLDFIYNQTYDMIFKWIPFLYYGDREVCTQMLDAVVNALPPGGILFLVGPRPIAGLFDQFGLEPIHDDPVVEMPFFREHLKMCPENRVNPDVSVFLTEKNR